MHSITDEQINAINAKMHNGFHLDERYYIFRGQKRAMKDIQLDERTTLTATLTWQRSYEQKPTSYHDTINMQNGMYHIALHLAVWHIQEGSSIATSRGPWQWIAVGPDVKRRNFPAIQRLTAKYDDAAILAQYDAIRHKADVPHA